MVAANTLPCGLERTINAVSDGIGRSVICGVALSVLGGAPLAVALTYAVVAIAVREIANPVFKKYFEFEGATNRTKFLGQLLLTATFTLAGAKCAFLLNGKYPFDFLRQIFAGDITLTNCLKGYLLSCVSYPV